MSKLHWKPGTMLYPVPPVMVTCGDLNQPNIITVAWAGTVCTNPAMVSISIRKERYSYDLIVSRGEFVINLTTKSLARAADYCGVRSGRDVNKFKEMHLTPEPSVHVDVPMIKESPLNIECRVKQILELGSHDMIIAEVLGVNVDESLLSPSGKLELEKSQLITYSHGAYFELGSLLGTFGYSVKKDQARPKRSTKKDVIQKNAVHPKSENTQTKARAKSEIKSRAKTKIKPKTKPKFKKKSNQDTHSNPSKR